MARLRMMRAPQKYVQGRCTCAMDKCNHEMPEYMFYSETHRAKCFCGMTEKEAE